MIKAILFDLDNTLLDRDASVLAFISNQYDRLQSSLNGVNKQTYVKRFVELDNHGYVWKDEVYRQLIEEFELGMTWEAMLDDYVREFRHSCVPYPNLHAMLENVRKRSIQLGMITNGYGQFQLNNIKALQIDHLFEAILISEWEGVKKPNASIFEKALNRMGVEPHESVFVGDHPVNDVAAAKSVGMTAVWKRNATFSESAEADYTIDGLDEIGSVLENCRQIYV
ncbi:HAD-IA family hydrolase [Paenalkalicoccus suaedae]|uniref:HAD-IA family hydrolase n=1 Tax=Paenalkalicoccus suaedae TaxID=2592382 RepID=A0A859FAG7_9BACI|nr:HAD-IA family hydrolase [Paenalkalicoccus suaedae]QKS69910.1 HAD-IA family hydrolase [Paenalkalicoccus suaedae]